MKQTVVIYSGGMDSFTLAAMTHQQGDLHSCLSFDYGQRHRVELEYARQNCQDWGVPHHIVDLHSVGDLIARGEGGGALLRDQPVPEGHYADENMKQTVVPNRNMIMLSIAAGYAMSHKLRVVRYGAHSGDHTIYPDCRPEFVKAMIDAVAIADWHRVWIETPFLGLDKTSILKIGFAIGLDYARSWTCYKGNDVACGKCGSCQERLEAFKNLGERDPLEYLQDEPGRDDSLVGAGD